MTHPVQSPAPDQVHTTDTSMTDFRAATTDQWRAAFLNGDVSAVELATTALTAEAAASSLGVFIHADADAALARASEMDAVREMIVSSARSGAAARLSDLSAHHPMLGLPTAFKDLVDVAGMPTTLGTAALPPRIPSQDDALARRVHAAGAVSVGKTQVPEFGLPCYSENSLALPSRNPLDRSRTSGGSTGGGAAAVAAGILPVAPGNDGGGSIRIPAAACGLVGLKPGRARLPDDVQGTEVRNLAVSGPLAQTAQDAALLFDVMAGHRFRLPETAPPLSRRRRRRAESSGLRADLMLAEGPAMRTVRRALDGGLDPLRIGVTTESPFSPDLDVVLEESAVIGLEKGIEALRDLGHQVQGTENRTGRERFWPHGYHQHFKALWTSRLADVGFTQEQLEKLTPLTRHFVELASARAHQDTKEAVRSLQAAADDAESLVGRWDVLLTPMLAYRPPLVGWFAGHEPAEDYLQQCLFTPYSSVVNVLGLPAINVPMHADDDGLSWSVQVIGRQGTEELLLALAATMMHR